MRIRPATENDIEECVGIALGMILEGWWKDEPFSSEKMRDHAYKYLLDENKLFLVAEEEGTVYGFFSAKVTYTFFGHSVHGEEELLYVVPEKRTGTTALKFMREFEKWARSFDARHIYFAPTDTQRRQWDALSKRLGYTYLGPAYGKKL